MELFTHEKSGTHKAQTRRYRAMPYIALGSSIGILCGGLYLTGLYQGEEEAVETRIVGKTVDGYLADNDTFRNRRFLEVFASSNTFRFIVTTPDLSYECDGSYTYDDGKVYINEQKIACTRIEDVPQMPELPTKV